MGFVMTGEDVKPRAGRPPRHKGERLSKSRTFRIRDDIDAELIRSAEESGLSVSEMIERRLSQYGEMRLEIARMREVVSTTQKTLELLREHHEVIEGDLRAEIKSLISELNKMIDKDNNKTVDDLETELSEFGFAKIMIADEGYVWARPGVEWESDILTNFEASLLADRLQPLLRKALIDAAVEMMKESKT